MSNFKLYVDANFLSPYAMSVFVALHEKKLAFDITAIDLASKENNQASYVETSITSRVPTLIHSGFALSESSAITEYLEDVFPNLPLYPESVQHRARARQVQAWLRSDLMPLRQERSTEVVFNKPTDVPLTLAALDAVQKLFFAANTWLKPNAENLFGAWCIADLDLALMLNRLVLNGDPVPERLSAYAKHQWQRPSVQIWVNQRRNLGGHTTPDKVVIK
jgi:glutathione S-transferase